MTKVVVHLLVALVTMLTSMWFLVKSTMYVIEPEDSARCLLTAFLFLAISKFFLWDVDDGIAKWEKEKKK